MQVSIQILLSFYLKRKLHPLGQTFANRVFAVIGRYADFKLMFHSSGQKIQQYLETQAVNLKLLGYNFICVSDYPLEGAAVSHIKAQLVE